jgi:hypothetical protein
MEQFISTLVILPLGIEFFLAFVLIFAAILVFKKKTNKNLLQKASPFALGSILISFIASVFFDTKNEIASSITLLIFLLLAIYEIIIIYKGKGQRLFYSGFLSLLLVYLAANVLVAYFMIANDWM